MDNSPPAQSPAWRVSDDESRFSPAMLFAAAKMYYEEDATQATIAEKLGTSRATVSRLLTEARRRGIVRIEVRNPVELDHNALVEQLELTLGLRKVYLSAQLPAPTATQTIESIFGRYLAPAVSRALADVGMVAGDILLVSSGRTVYEVAQYDLPRIPGILVAPTVGGADQPEEWYQTNEITRLMSNRLGGRPNYLFAPALPGPELYDTLRNDPAIQRVLQLWPAAKCALLGIGAPPLLRADIPSFVPTFAATMREAVGDVCSRFYDRFGKAVNFPGRDRLIAIELSVLEQIPVTIGVAVGTNKVPSIQAGARAGYFNTLVTDPLTAQQLIATD